MHPTLLSQFKAYFEEMDLKDLTPLEWLYAEDIRFKDPIHEIVGREALKAYFQKLNDNLLSGSFVFERTYAFEGVAYLTWEMHLDLKRPKKQIVAEGLSVLTGDQHIQFQRDYFDAGQVFYEHVPLLGSMVRYLKKQLGR